MSRNVPDWPPVDVEPVPVHPKAPSAGTKLGPHYSECFGCGDEVPTGLRLQSTMGDEHTVHSQFTVTAAHQGAPGLAHGGLLAAAFDEALGATVGYQLRKPAVTGRLETDFLRPVPVGSTLFIVGKLDGMAGRKVYVSANGHLDAEDGPIALRARALFVIVAVEHFTTHGDKDAIAKLSESSQRRPDLNP
ncbi:PaaI family thioesterase [Amycolatopsis sp. cg5]|uniref:PaaI family thioesterase n=1 Tax=Amycolatopsis sp. cg5 TaxID=3238802 RepID=UPI0035234310